MKKHLNTLYITSDDAFVRKERETFIVEINNEKVFQAPIHSIENIVCFGFKPLTPQVMAFCAENNVGISYLTETGQFLARVYGAQKGNVLLRKAQYAFSDNEFQCLQIAKPIIAAKVSNYRYILLRHQRNHPENCSDDVVLSSEIMGKRITNIQQAESLDELRGYEGECATLYFGSLSSLITVQKEDFLFTQRTKRPPLDPANALLSFLYAILVNDVRSALETVGLDPQVGFLHQIRSGRPSLALDIMEEFRPVLADRLAVTLINRGQLRSTDFEERPGGAVLLGDKGRKTVIGAYQERKQDSVTHPVLEQATPVGLLPHVQARLLARHLRGDAPAYVPYLHR